MLFWDTVYFVLKNTLNTNVCEPNPSLNILFIFELLNSNDTQMFFNGFPAHNGVYVT